MMTCDVRTTAHTDARRAVNSPRSTLFSHSSSLPDLPPPSLPRPRRSNPIATASLRVCPRAWPRPAVSPPGDDGGRRSRTALTNMSGGADGCVRCGRWTRAGGDALFSTSPAPPRLAASHCAGRRATPRPAPPRSAAMLGPGTEARPIPPRCLTDSPRPAAPPPAPRLAERDE